MRRALGLSVLLLAACGHERVRLEPGEQGEVVEAEGWAPVDASDPLGTKRRSLADAQKKAVERVAGVFIAAKTRVDQTVAVDERILAKAEGYVRKYDVLSEREDGGFLKTRIKAAVLYRKLADDAKALGLTKPPAPPGNPRVSLTLEPGAEAAQAALTGSLLAHGLSVVGPTAGGSDILLQAQAQTRAMQDARLGELKSARTRLTVQATKTKSGEVLAVKTEEAAAVDASPEGAAAKALAKAGAAAGEAIAAELAPLLKSQLGVAVRVNGLVDFDAARRLVDDIRMNPDVAAVTLSDYGEGLARLQVTTEGLPGDELSALLVKSRKFHLTAVTVSAYAVELSVR
jgi:hypothetical protein